MLAAACPATHYPHALPHPRAQLDVATTELLEPEVPVKRLLLLVELARQGLEAGQRAVPLARWTQIIQDLAML